MEPRVWISALLLLSSIGVSEAAPDGSTSTLGSDGEETGEELPREVKIGPNFEQGEGVLLP